MRPSIRKSRPLHSKNTARIVRLRHGRRDAEFADLNLLAAGVLILARKRQTTILCIAIP